jgi:hypothetical protein
MAVEGEDEDVVHGEVQLFKWSSVYVYRIPPASTIGHRAEMWNVDSWFQVSGRFLTRATQPERLA